MKMKRRLLGSEKGLGGRLFAVRNGMGEEGKVHKLILGFIFCSCQSAFGERYEQRDEVM